MKLPEAIEITKIIKEDCARLNEPRSEDALKLGIEAMERLRINRKQTTIEWVTLLPGETAE